MSLITSSVRMGDTGKPAMSGISYLRDYISRGELENGLLFLLPWISRPGSLVLVNKCALFWCWRTEAMLLR